MAENDWKIEKKKTEERAEEREEQKVMRGRRISTGIKGWKVE